MLPSGLAKHLYFLLFDLHQNYCLIDNQMKVKRIRYAGNCRSLTAQLNVIPEKFL